MRTIPYLGKIFLAFSFTLCCGAVFAKAPADTRFQGQELHILNWSEYLQPVLIAAFEDQYGVKIKQTFYESEADRDEILSESGINGFDLAIVESMMLNRYRQLGWIEPFDRHKISNLNKLDPRCIKAAGDDSAYSVPYLWGTTGIAYRSDLIDKPIMSWLHLYQPDESLRGHILMIDDAMEVLRLAARALGHSINSEDPQVWAEAASLAADQRPYLHSYGIVTLDETSSLLSGEVWAAQIYNGDAAALQEYNEQIVYVTPHEGSASWVDHWVIFANAPHRELAHVFLSFINDPKRAASNAQSLYFATCNEAAEAMLPAVFLNDPVVYPPAEVVKKLEPYRPLSARTIRRINTYYAGLKSKH